MARSSLLASLAVFVLLLAALSTSAEIAVCEVELRLEVVGDAKRFSTSGTVTFEPAVGEGKVLTLELDGASAITAKLPQDTVWRQSADLDGYWTPSNVLAVGQEPRSTHTIRLWPSSRIAGTVKAASDIALPKLLRLKFQSPFEPRKVSRGAVESTTDGIAKSTLSCPIDDRGDWICELPATPLDLAIGAKGFVSHYRWGVHPPAGKTLRLGTFTLKPGASLVGRAELASGAPPGRACKARLLPLVAPGRDARTAAEIRRMTFEEGVGQNGFFQIAGITPGSYLLEIEQPGYAPGKVFPLEIWPGAETSLKDPVVLHRPLTLELTVSPALDAVDQPWQALVFRASDHSAGFDTDPIHSGPLSREGRLRLPGQAPGIFMLKILDASQNVYFSLRDLMIEDAADARIDVEIDLIPIRGTVTLADEPLAGQVWFGGRFGKLRIRMDADVDGEFQGLLPHAGNWAVQVLATEHDVETRMTVEVPKSRRREAVVEIELPDTEIYGSVVDDRGGVAKAAVFSMDGKRPVHTRTEENGEFRLRGIPAGELRLMARTTSRQNPRYSETVDLEIQESSPVGPIELRLIETDSVSGQVFSPRGPVIGAIVHVSTLIPVGQGFTEAVRADVSGAFVARTAKDADLLRVVVSPPGHALQVFLVEPKSEPFLLEVSPQGGTIEVRVETLEDGRPKLPVFARDGVEIPVNLLMQWARGHGVFWRGDTLRLSRMAAGDYRVCRRQSADHEHARRSHDAGRCVQGYLHPGDVLKLDLDR